MSDVKHDPDEHPRPDLDEALDEARSALPREELERTLLAGEEAAEQATLRESLRWVVWLLVAGTVLTAVIADWRFLIPGLLLMAWYSLPLIIAADSDAADDAEAEVLHDAVERRTHGRGDAP